MYGLPQAKYTLFMRPWFFILYDNIGQRCVYRPFDRTARYEIYILYNDLNLVWNSNFKILSANGDTYYTKKYK